MSEEAYINNFWDVIERGSYKGESAGETADRLIGALASMDEESVIQWGLIFDRYQKLAYKGKLWGAANIMDNGFCSDDGYTDFRAWLISQGREVYHAALQDPDSLAVLPVQEDVCFESVNYVAMDAYERITGKDYYKAIEHVWLSPEIGAAIADGIAYAADIDVNYVNGHYPHIYPRLTELYERDRHSIRRQLRQATQEIDKAKTKQQTVPRQGARKEVLE